MRVIAIAAPLLLAAAIPAQVRALCTLVRGAATQLESWLAESPMAGEVVLRFGDDSRVRAALSAGEIDVVIGADVVLCAELARQGLLGSYHSPAAAALIAPVAVDGGLYTIPWLMPMTLAYDPEVWTAAGAPRDISDVLFEGQFREQLLITSPTVMPSPWLGWIHNLQLRGYSDEQIIAWLRKLDAAVVDYASSLGEVRMRQTNGEASLALLPWSSPPRRVGNWQWIVPHSGMPVKALAVALRAGAPPQSGALCDLLLSPECALALAEADLLPAPRSDLPAEDLPAALREIASQVILLDYADADASRWLTDWQTAVRGKGKELATLELVLDVLFGVLFLIFLFAVYRRIVREETKTT